MDLDTYNYYKEQLDEIRVQDDESSDVSYAPSFQFRNGLSGQTKWLQLNKESVKELRRFLDRIELSLDRY